VDAPEPGRFRTKVAEAAVMILGLVVVLGVCGAVIYFAGRNVQADQARALQEVDKTARAVFDDVAAAALAGSETAYREALRPHDAELTWFSAQGGQAEFTILIHKTAASGGEKLQHFRRCFTYTVPAAGTPSYRNVDCPPISPGESWKYIG
jgi:hypothetical protein